MTPKGGDEERQVVSERNSNLAPLYHIQLSERVGDFFFFFLQEDGGAGRAAHPQMPADFLKPSAI